MEYKFEAKSWMRDVLVILLLPVFSIILLTTIPLVNLSNLRNGFDIAYILSAILPPVLVLIYYGYSTRNKLTATIAGLLMWPGTLILAVIVTIIAYPHRIPGNPDILSIQMLGSIILMTLSPSVTLGVIGYVSAAKMPKYIQIVPTIIYFAMVTLFILLMLD